MELWILFTLGGAFLQNLRSLWQRQLTGRLSLLGATSVRFLYGLPFALAYLALLGPAPAALLPVSSAFWWYALGGALAQMLATWLLLKAFQGRGFAVGTLYAKTEALQATLLSLLLLGEWVSATAGAAIVLSVLGVMLMSLPPRQLAGVPVRGWFGAGACYGLGAGGLFALASVCYRGASLASGLEHYLHSATLTLCWVMLAQCLLLWLCLRWWEPGQLRLTLVHWRLALPAGMAGMGASACWFSAMTLQHAAYVKALGQIELLFTFLVSLLWLRERVRPLEWLGTLLLVGGIILLAWGIE